MRSGGAKGVTGGKQNRGATPRLPRSTHPRAIHPSATSSRPSLRGVRRRAQEPARRVQDPARHELGRRSRAARCLGSSLIRREREPVSGVHVALENLPVDLLRAVDEATEALLRDYVLDALEGRYPFSVEDVATGRRAKHLLLDAVGVTALALRAPDSGACRPRSCGVRAAAGGARSREPPRVRRGLARAAVLPEVAALRNWMCDEVLGQAGGANRIRGSRSSRSWRVRGCRPQAGRACGASACANCLLGWESLAGERLIVIIPPASRERHLATSRSP